MGRSMLRGRTSPFFVVFVLAVGTAAGQGPGETAVHRPTIITEPGSYVLQRGFSMPGAGTAVVIRANSVTLDLNGHALGGPGDKRGVGISVENATGVQIRGGAQIGHPTRHGPPNLSALAARIAHPAPPMRHGPWNSSACPREGARIAHTMRHGGPNPSGDDLRPRASG